MYGLSIVMNQRKPEKQGAEEALTPAFERQRCLKQNNGLYQIPGKPGVFPGITAGCQSAKNVVV